MSKARWGRKHYFNSLSSLYGMSYDEYQKQIRLQEGHCIICNTRPYKKAVGPSDDINPRARRTGLVVDHDHATGKWRGLLCVRCNALLGQATEDIRVLLAAAAYLWRQKNGVPITSRFTLYALADELFELLDSTDFDVETLRGRRTRAA